MDDLQEHKKEDEQHNIHHEHSVHNIHHEHSEHPAHHTNHDTKDNKEDASIEPKNAKDDSKSIIFIILAVCIIILIIGAILFISKHLSNNNNVVEYNNYVFQKFETNKWITQQQIRGQLYNIPFYNNPTQVLDVPIDQTSIDAIRNFSFNPNGVVYLTVSPYTTSKIVLAGIEYARILGNVYNIYNMTVKSAIDTPVAGFADAPVITCANQSSDVLVIHQIVTNKNLVSINGNCILVESESLNESVRVADAFAFRLLNIIPG